MKRPPGLKIMRNFCSEEEVNEILQQPQFVNNPTMELFRLFGEFGGKAAQKPDEWMIEYGTKIFRKYYIFPEVPNQYRVCDWIGELSSNFKWHIDNKRHGKDILVITLSEKRLIGFRRDPDAEVYKVELSTGDAYLMSGSSRWSWEHCVLPSGKEKSGGKSFIMSYRKQKK
ncbi:hypothetical protein [Candidatus Uabimicrobium amorphum]|uniref:Fe2OG dioxygenase domain-containing protein n=1 Tax=Uabimicrobium amorphum TaxID=2596890 RepID=A0A5S9F3W1_UABAM|nr:hypothetical protein [Candidatus Uabimicrobium amorphum]BBM84661.1 hypothetical protein UABAM_03022 [Candidatus Uabimicrobium amorphum]